jgi:hypothetical protein
LWQLGERTDECVEFVFRQCLRLNQGTETEVDDAIFRLVNECFQILLWKN